MICPDCGNRTRVVNTRPQPGGVRRQRACSCGFGAYSAEVWLRTPMPTPPAKVYTADEVASIKKAKVTTRRKNEDRRKDNAS